MTSGAIGTTGADPAPIEFAAVILAGGRGSRLGGIAKPLIDVGGRRMLQVALDAAAGAEQVVVVGDVPVPSGVLRTIEDPPHSGPAAALAAGVRTLTGAAPWILVLASDLPGADRAVPALLETAAHDESSDGVCYHDAEHRPQWLLAVYRVAPLREAIDSQPTTGLSLHRLVAPLELTTIPGDAAAIRDCDTWEDIEAAQSASEEADDG